MQQSCEIIDTSGKKTREDLEMDLEVNARHDGNVISQQVDNSFDSHDAGILPYVSKSDKKVIINTFKNVNELDHIQFEIIDARGQKEDGPGLGAERNLYGSFFSEVADSLCVGASERVPFVRHDFYKRRVN